MLRVKFRPEAKCSECVWSFVSNEPLTVRSRAERHVVETGHRVHVDILDRTQYSLDGITVHGGAS